MATKRTGISAELLIHPGETIADILEERHMTQAELAMRTDATPTYVCNVLSGKKGISARFAMALEYALGVPKSFWLNLQSHYEAELLEINELSTVTQAECKIAEEMEQMQKIPNGEPFSTQEKQEQKVLYLRRKLRVSNLTNAQVKSM